MTGCDETIFGMLFFVAIPITGPERPVTIGPTLD